jgi:SPW repeat-containing protein
MSERAMTGMDQHPDIMELRARYERAAATPLAQFADGLVFLTGLYLAISPWVVGFAGMRSIAVNDLITGVALALVGGGLASAYGRTHGMAWVAPIIGIWTIITPWVIRGGIASTATTGTIASNVAVGAVAVVAGLAAMSVGTLSRR